MTFLERWKKILKSSATLTHPSDPTYEKLWWLERWEGLAQDFVSGTKLNLNRLKLTQDQVKDLSLEKGRISARIEDGQPKPISVEIQVQPFSRQGTEKIVQQLEKNPLVLTRLFSGELPLQLENILVDTGFNLFPKKEDILETRCPCADSVRPCSHIALTFFLASKNIHEDPFQLLKLRGIDRDQFIHFQESEKNRSADSDFKKRSEGSSEKPRPLATSQREFWGQSSAKSDALETLRIPENPISLPARLGPFPSWESKENFLKTMGKIYRTAAAEALDIFVGFQERKKRARRGKKKK